MNKMYVREKGKILTAAACAIVKSRKHLKWPPIESQLTKDSASTDEPPWKLVSIWKD